MTVALDTELTPELIREGWIRDFIRGVQDARKTAGLQIEDRITLRYRADLDLIAAVAASEGYVMTETLATLIEGVKSDGTASDGYDTIEVGDRSAAVHVERA